MANVNFEETMVKSIGPALFRLVWWNHLDPTKRTDFAEDLVDVILEGIVKAHDVDQGKATDAMMKATLKPFMRSVIESRMGRLAPRMPKVGNETYEIVTQRIVALRSESSFNEMFAQQYDAFAARISKLSADLISAVKLINEEFVIWLKTYPDHSKKIHQDAFEQLVGEILSSHSFTVEFTGRIKNKSADLFAVEHHGMGEKYLVECKRYSADNKVNLNVVNSVVGASSRARTNHAMLVTTSAFTRNALQAQAELKDFRLDLQDGRKVEEWLSGYQFKEHGLWLPEGWQDRWAIGG